MSADDFQTKYSSVMEGMLKSAVAETTKLFETMVDELKAEISKVKKENEDLKRKCSQFEKATRQTTNDCQESMSNPRKSGCSEKRDTAIQCDLVPFRAMLVEQCEPLQPSTQPDQDQPCGYDTMEYVWKEHNYENREGRSSQMAFILVKQKDSPQQTVVKQEDAEPLLSCGRVLDTKDVTSASENENGRQMPSQESSSAEMPLPQRNEKSQVGLEMPQLKRAGSLSGVHNLSSGLEHSLPAVKGNMEKETEGSSQLSERSEADLQENEMPSDGTLSVNKQRDVGCSNQLADRPTPHENSKANDEQINGKMAETEPDQPVRRKRGRPPKKTKQQPVKQILLPKCTSENKTPGAQQLSLSTKDGPGQTPSLAVSSAVPKPNTPTTEPPQKALPQSRERRTSATLQDAMLLVEAMNQSTDENTPSSPQRIAAKTQTLQTVQEVPGEPEKTPISFETGEVASNVPPEATTAAESQVQEKTVALQQQPAVTPSCTNTPPVARSAAATQTNVHSIQQDHSQIKSVAHSQQGDAVTRKIIVMSRSSASMMHCKFAGKFAAKQPSVVPKVIAAQNISELPKLTPTGTLPVKVPLSSAPQKNILIIPDKPLSAPPTDLQSVSLSQPSITILIPRQLSALALSKPSQVIDLTTKQGSGKSPNPDAVPSQLISSFPEVDKVTTVLTTELTNNTFDNLESQKQSTNVCTYTAEQTPPVVVRLTRLPFPMSTQETVSVLSLHSGKSPETQSPPKEGITKEEPLSVVASSQPSETEVSSSDMCVNTKEACVVGFDDSADCEYVAAEFSTSELEKETDTVAQDSTSPNVPPTEQPSPAVIHLMSIKSGDTSDPHSQMTKTQFLAKLAVSPILQDQEEPPTDDPVTTNASCPMSSTCDKRSLRTNTLVAKLRRHLKTHLRDRPPKTNQELCIETEIQTASPEKPEIKADGADDDSQTVEPIPLNPKKQLTVVQTTSPNETTNDTSPVSTRRSRICKDGLKSKNSTGEPARVSPQRLRATGDSTPMSHRRSCSVSDSVSSKTKKSTSVSPRRSNSAREGAISAISIKRQIVFNSPRKSSSTKERASLKKIRTTTIHSRRTSSTRDSASPKRNTVGSHPTISETPRTTKSTGSSVHTVVGTPTEGIKSGTNPHSARRLQLGEVVRSSKSGESTPGQKRKLIPEGSILNDNLELASCKRLAKTTTARTEARIQNKSSATPESVKRLSSKSVWTPPVLPACETPLAGAKKSPNSMPIKTETKTLNPALVYPPSVSLHPIPVWAPPVVSPLQPLSVIGWRLLKNQCGECGRVLSSSAALESHVSLHTGHRPFSCKLCGKRFPDSKGLKRHGRVHRNGRIHICKQCGKGFVYSFGLTKHLQMVHSRIKPFVCQICNKGFFSKRDVEAHIRIHTGEKPFHCNLCEKKFARRTELNMHLRWHNGEKRHWCPFCGKGFLDINNLKRHKYTHTGEKPHSCPHCPKHFTQSGHLKKHVRNVHKIQ